MENYTINYHKTFLTDISKGLQAALDAYKNQYIKQAIYAFGSPTSKDDKLSIEFATAPQGHCFTDYVLLEQQLNKQKIYQRYLEEQSEAKEIPLLSKFIPSLEKSYTSLFRIIDVDVEEGIIYFDDVLGVKENQEIAIIDKILADTIDRNPINMNFLMFFRFIPFLGDFIDMNDEEDVVKGMTNGYIYIFNPQEEHKIIKEYEKMAAKVRVSKSSSKRQIAFTELDKKYGQKLLLS